MLNELLIYLLLGTLCKTLKNNIFCSQRAAKCPHSLLDKLLKSVDRISGRDAYSTHSSVFVKRLFQTNLSFYQTLVTVSALPRVSGAHYREGSVKSKGFLTINDIFISFA